MTTVTAEPRAASPRIDRAHLIPAVALVALFATAAALQPSFLAVGNLQNLLTQAAPLLLAVMGQSLVMLVRGLDLSVASVMATTAVTATAFDATTNGSIPFILLCALALSASVGLVNGLLVTRRGVSPFIATLATMIVLQGLRFAYTKGAPSGALPPGLRYLGTGSVLGVPVDVLVFLALFAALGFVLNRTVFGRSLYIVGGNPRAADLVGVPSARITLAAYVLSAMFAGLAGVLLVGYVGAVDNWVGRGYELDSIVAAVIGGVSLAGGAGSLFGAVAGGLVLVVVSNIVVILGLPVQAQLVFKGVIIVAATALYARSQTGSR